MKILSRIVILFILAIMVAGISEFDTGEAIFLVDKYQIQLSINLLIILLLLLFILVYFILRMYINVRRIPNKIQSSRFRSMLVSSKKHLNQAGVHFFEGKYRSCFESAMKSIKKEPDNDNKFLAYMLAYKSAGIMRDHDREEYISEELKKFDEPKWQLSKFVAIAENFYYKQQYGQCIDNLQLALKIDRSHVPAHFMLMKVYLALNNYTKAYEMLEWLMQNDSIQESKANKYKLKVVSGILKDSTDISAINKIFAKLDKLERVSFQYSKLYFDALMQNSFYDDGIKFLEKNSNEDGIQMMMPDAVLFLSKVANEDNQLNKLLCMTEIILNSSQNDNRILLALGILSYKLNLMKKAQLYLEASESIKPTQDVYVYLVMVAEAINNEQLKKSSLNKIFDRLHQDKIKNI